MAIELNDDGSALIPAHEYVRYQFGVGRSTTAKLFLENGVNYVLRLKEGWDYDLKKLREMRQWCVDNDEKLNASSTIYWYFSTENVAVMFKLRFL